MFQCVSPVRDIEIFLNLFFYVLVCFTSYILQFRLPKRKVLGHRNIFKFIFLCSSVFHQLHSVVSTAHTKGPWTQKFFCFQCSFFFSMSKDLSFVQSKLPKKFHSLKTLEIATNFSLKYQQYCVSLSSCLSHGVGVCIGRAITSVHHELFLCPFWTLKKFPSATRQLCCC